MTVNNFKTSIIYYLLNPNIQFDELSSRLLIFKIFFYIVSFVAPTNFNTIAYCRIVFSFTYVIMTTLMEKSFAVSRFFSKFAKVYAAKFFKIIHPRKFIPAK